MNQSERHSQTVGNGSGPLRSASIRTDDNGLLVYQGLVISISLGKCKSIRTISNTLTVWYACLNITFQDWPSIPANLSVSARRFT